MAAKPSKNQRAGPAKKYAHPRCPRGHNIIRVLVAQQNGNRMRWRCQDEAGAVLAGVCA